jgi:hypothetical protein
MILLSIRAECWAFHKARTLGLYEYERKKQIVITRSYAVADRRAGKLRDSSLRSEQAP